MPSGLNPRIFATSVAGYHPTERHPGLDQRCGYPVGFSIPHTLIRDRVTSMVHVT